MQRIPAGLPWGMPGTGDEIEGAIQQAAQPGRHSMSGPIRHGTRVARFAGDSGLAQATTGLGDVVALSNLPGSGAVDMFPADTFVVPV